VMSLKLMPARGKSGISRISSRSATGVRSIGSAHDLAQVPDQQQVLEMRGDGGEVLERLDGLLAPLGVARAQRRRDDLLEQVRRGAGGGICWRGFAPRPAEERTPRGLRPPPP